MREVVHALHCCKYQIDPLSIHVHKPWDETKYFSLHVQFVTCPVSFDPLKRKHLSFRKIIKQCTELFPQLWQTGRSGCLLIYWWEFGQHDIHMFATVLSGLASETSLCYYSSVTHVSFSIWLYAGRRSLLCWVALLLLLWANGLIREKKKKKNVPQVTWYWGTLPKQNQRSIINMKDTYFVVMGQKSKAPTCFLIVEQKAEQTWVC